MRSLRQPVAAIALIACSLTAVSSAQAGVSGGSWSNPNGSNANFTWSNGQTQNGYYGSPLVLETGMYFTPGSFASVQTNGGMATITDMATVDIALNQPPVGPRKQFSGFRITQRGDFALMGTASANIVGGLQITVLESIPAPVVGDPSYVQIPAGTVYGINDVSGYRHYAGSTAIPLSPMSFPAAIDSGTLNRLWDGSLEVVLPAGITKVGFQMTNSMTTTASDGSVALMQMKSVEDPFNIQVFAGDIPEPTTLLVLGSAGVLLLKRRGKVA